jgi:hypothetical protein
MPMLTKTPAPTMEPRPIMVAPKTPTSRFNVPVAVSVTGSSPKLAGGELTELPIGRPTSPKETGSIA